MTSQAADVVWAVFLRGMNLGRRRLTNDSLRSAAERSGCRDVRTYQASGNLVVTDERSEEDLAAALERGLEEALDHQIPVFLRTAGEVRSIAAATPFSETSRSAGTGRTQVIFLRAAVSADVLRQAEPLFPEDDRMVAAGRQLYWLPAAGLADSDLDLRRLDVVTGGTTIRTHGTVQRLASKFL